MFQRNSQNSIFLLLLWDIEIGKYEGFRKYKENQQKYVKNQSNRIIFSDEYKIIFTLILLNLNAIY
jgi:hypothetical protein